MAMAMIYPEAKRGRGNKEEVIKTKQEKRYKVTILATPC
jgi:hypothetical protein